jgi:hypothetical protein
LTWVDVDGVVHQAARPSHSGFFSNVVLLRPLTITHELYAIAKLEEVRGTLLSDDASTQTSVLGLEPRPLFEMRYLRTMAAFRFASAPAPTAPALALRGSSSAQSPPVPTRGCTSLFIYNAQSRMKEAKASRKH